MSLNKLNRVFVSVLCALAVLAVSFACPREGEAAPGRVVRAPVRGGTARAPRVFARGAGTQRSPYVLSTAAQLTAFAASVSGGNDYAGKHVRLGADIDLKDTAWTSAGLYSSGNSRSFKGLFDGAGFTIYNMGAGNGGKPAGALFGALDGAEVRNVSLQFVELAGDSNVGALAGFMTGSTMKNCLVSGTVKGQSAVGGFVGSALKGIIENCEFSGSVTGESGAGGIAGTIDSTAIRSCGVVGTVEGDTDTGGFVGGILDGIITGCSANSVTVSGRRNVGGFAGNIIDGVYVSGAAFRGQVTANSNAGGVAGRMGEGTITACSVSGSVKGREGAGGIVGELIGGNVRGCQAAADVNGMTGLGGITGLMHGGSLDGNSNRGLVSGGEAVGGIVGNLAGGMLNFSSNTSTGRVSGHLKTGPIVGAQSN